MMFIFYEVYFFGSGEPSLMYCRKTMESPVITVK